MFPGHCNGVNKLQYGTCRGCNMLCLYRRTLVSMRELQDWSVQQQQQRWKHSNAWADFLQKVEALQADPYCTIFLQDFDPAGQQPCICFVQTQDQLEWLQRFCPDIVFVDSTHGTNNHNMQLYTTVIPCEARQGLPAAFCLVYAPGVPFDIRYTLFSLCCHASM